MASFNVQGIDDLIKAMEMESERIDRNGPAAVKAGAQVLAEAFKQAAPVRTGGLSEHIKVKGPMYDSIDGHHCDVFPSGKDPRGERYETIGFVLENGRSIIGWQKHGWTERRHRCGCLTCDT